MGRDGGASSDASPFFVSSLTLADLLSLTESECTA